MAGALYLTMILRRGGEAADFIEVFEEKTRDVRSEEVEDRRPRRYESPAGDGVRPPARQKPRLRDRRRRVGRLRGRAPPPRRHRRHRSPPRGGRTRRRRRQPLEPVAVGGEPWLALSACSTSIRSSAPWG